ncbi:MAG TPA: hypothetical protein V6C65_02800 [Allocoleopsis sp.]
MVIGTVYHVGTRGYAKTCEWSKPQPAPEGSGKVLVALNRIMV